MTSASRKRRKEQMGYHKISVNLSDEVMQALKEMAQRDSITMTEVLRRSISTQKFLDEAQRQGKALLLEDPETREVQRVVFR
jgi:predicted transcriptional regulator